MPVLTNNLPAVINIINSGPDVFVPVTNGIVID